MVPRWGIGGVQRLWSSISAIECWHFSSPVPSVVHCIDHSRPGDCKAFAPLLSCHRSSSTIGRDNSSLWTGLGDTLVLIIFRGWTPCNKHWTKRLHTWQLWPGMLVNFMWKNRPPPPQTGICPGLVTGTKTAWWSKYIAPWHCFLFLTPAKLDLATKAKVLPCRHCHASRGGELLGVGGEMLEGGGSKSNQSSTTTSSLFQRQKKTGNLDQAKLFPVRNDLEFFLKVSLGWTGSTFGCISNQFLCKRREPLIFTTVAVVHQSDKTKRSSSSCKYFRTSCWPDVRLCEQLKYLSCIFLWNCVWQKGTQMMAKLSPRNTIVVQLLGGGGIPRSVFSLPNCKWHSQVSKIQWLSTKLKRKSQGSRLR